MKNDSKTTLTTMPNISIWIGRILSALVVAFLLFDGISKLIQPAAVIEATEALGYSEGSIFILGILVLIGTLLYIIPQTSVLGAIFLTAFLGGAVASHLRIGNPLVSHTLFPVYFGLMLWAGLYLRDRRLHRIIPFFRA